MPALFELEGRFYFHKNVKFKTIYYFLVHGGENDVEVARRLIG